MDALLDETSQHLRMHGWRNDGGLADNKTSECGIHTINTIHQPARILIVTNNATTLR